MHAGRSPPSASTSLNFFWNTKESQKDSSNGSSKGTFRVAISGCSGLVGSALCDELQQKRIGGKEVEIVQLKRKGGAGVVKGGVETVEWSVETGVEDLEGLEGVDAVVHLAGENIAGAGFVNPWGGDKKQRIMESRRQGTKGIADAIASLKSKPSVFVCASAVGFYGFESSDQELSETAPKGTGFLADVVEEWETASASAKAGGAGKPRIVNARFGVVLSERGGVLAKLLPLFKLGVGGNLGSGSQWFSWVSARDVARALVFMIENSSLSGPVNVVAPSACTNAQFTQALGNVLLRPTLIPAPGFALKLLSGSDFADELLLGGQKAVPSKLEAAGFSFEDPTIQDALSDILAKGD